MIKSLRLSWLERIFGDNSGTWNNNGEYLLKDTGGLMLFNCNYNVFILLLAPLFTQNYKTWWSEFRLDNAADNNWHHLIWNNQEIRINNKVL